VTVVFCDLCDSTQLGERLDPETLRQVIGSYFGAMSGVLERYEGAIEKFIGDAVMAVFTVPAVREDDALRAVRAAADMRAALAELNEELERRYGVTLQTHTGVNTGQVIAGDPARGGGFVSGDAVNVAARLQQAATPGEILIGERTLELVSQAVTVEPVPPLELRGKSRPVRAFRLLEVDVVPGVGGRGLTSPLVGRDRELERLQAAFRGTIDRHSGELLTIVGPAGVGKSRLAIDFAESVREQAAVAVGRCLSYGEGLASWPLREVVTAVAGSADGAGPDEVRSGLARVVEGDEDAAAIVERVAGAVGWSESAATPMETSWAFGRLLAAAASERPLVVVLEDVHWAEPVLLDLIEHVAASLEDVPVLIVALARRDLLDVRPGFGGDAPRLELEPLSGDDSGLLVEHLLGDDGVTAGLTQMVFARAEGNPLFVEELVRMLVDERQIERDDSGLSAVRSSPLSLPPTIHALLAARIDRLEPGERAVLDAGAVIDSSFGRGALLALVDEGDSEILDAQLQALVRRQLIAADGGRPSDDPTFSFTQALVRDVAYEGMLKARRADLHARYADWLECTAGDRVGEYDEILGYHLECAHRYASELGPVDERGRELGARAAARLGSSGGRALARGDVRSAMSLLERAVSLLDADDPARRELMIKLGVALAEGRAGAFVVFHDTGGGQHVVELSDGLAIGRRADNDVALPWDEEVSRRHARIVSEGEAWALVDDASRNGSYLNGARITEQSPLNDGDVLRFGDTVVLFRAPAAAPTRATVVPRRTGQG
jgi:class 3 adenylate cyclase